MEETKQTDERIILSENKWIPDEKNNKTVLLQNFHNHGIPIVAGEMWFQFWRIFPIADRVLFFSKRKTDKLDSNLEAIYPFVKSKKIICAHTTPISKLKKVYYLYKIATSKVIVLDDYCSFLKYVLIKPNQRVIQVWHASGALKQFGVDGSVLPESDEKASHVQYSLVSVSSNNIRDIYSKAFNISADRIQPLGVPQTDRFFQEGKINEACSAILHKHPELKGKKIIQYSPTFRDYPDTDRFSFAPPIDFDRLSITLKPDQVFVLTPHPVMRETIINKAYPNIIEIRDVKTEDMMLLSERLITDYSSVMFEYALLNKPIAFFCPDLNQYDRGFYLKYPEDLPGIVLRTQEELESYISDAGSKMNQDSIRQFTEYYMSACDGHSGERIAAMINQFVNP